MNQSKGSPTVSHLAQILEPHPTVVTPETLLSEAIAKLNKGRGNGCVLIVKPNEPPKAHPLNSILDGAGAYEASRKPLNTASRLVSPFTEQDLRRLVGIFTPKDLVRLVAGGIDLTATTIGEVMSQPVLTMKRSQCQDLVSVWSYLRQYSLDYLPILDESEQILGVITRDRLLQSFAPINELPTPPEEQAELELERFFAVTPTLFCIAGLDGYFKRLNPDFSKTLGYTTEELLAEPFINFVHPDDRAATLAEVASLKQGKVTISFENRYRTKDGSYRWLLWTARPYLEEQIIYAAARDITERKQTEIKLQQERDFTKVILDTVGALIAVLDRQGKIIGFNYTCERVTGYTFAEVEGKQLWELLIAEAERPAVRAVFAKMLAGQLPNHYENHWVAKDGSQHLISWSNTALFDERGNVEFIIATGLDVSEQRRMVNKLEHQYRQTQLLAEVTRKIRMSIELDEILQTTVTEVQHLLACDRVLIVKLQSNNTALPISEAIIPHLTPMLGYELADPLLVGQNLERYRQGKILSIVDVSSAAIDSDIKTLLQQFEIQAKLVVPILSQDKLTGLLIAHQCTSTRQWQNIEIELLQQLADQIGVALAQAQLLNNLEELVDEQTAELMVANQQLQEEIAERKRTEASLRESQQKLARILDNADEAIISIDEQQKIQLFNQGAEKIFGYSAGEIMGKPLDILLPEVFRQIHRQHIQNFATSREISRNMTERGSNVYGRRKYGEQFPAEASISKLRSRDGLIFTVMLKDITEQRLAAEKLQASRSLLAKAEKIAKMGSWEYNLVTKQLSWSEEIFHILDFDPTQSIPSCEKIFERIYRSDRSLVIETLHKGHVEGTPWQIVYRLIKPDKSIKYVESRGEPTLDREGNVLKVWGTIMDVSERVRAEKSLHRSGEQLRLITDSLPILIAYIDKQQRYRYNNQTYENWFGRSRDALKGLHIREVVGEVNYQKMLPYIETALSGQPVTFEIEPVDFKGNPYWVNVTYIPDISSEGQVKGFFSMVDDITERKAIEQMKSEFVSIASHEMRTPLTSIHGVIKLLCAERLGSLTPAGKEMANIALRNTDRLIRLINDVLDLERMESGQEAIKKQPCNSVDLIQQAIDTMQSMAEQHEITLVTEPNPIEFLADSDRILQTLTNLLSNGIKFSPPHSTVSIAVEKKDNEVLFIVKDEGRGIPSDKLETIFERFQQIDASDSRKKGGTGLGLAICRHIIEQHGGKIWVESVLNQGSTFFFTLPQQ